MGLNKYYIKGFKNATFFKKNAQNVVDFETLRNYTVITGFQKRNEGVIILKDLKRRHAPYSKFKAFLVERGIRQSEVAQLLGKSKSALNQNLNGTGGDFSLSEVRLICLTYKISADEYFLYPGVSKMKPETA